MPDSWAYKTKPPNIVEIGQRVRSYRATLYQKVEKCHFWGRVPIPVH